MRFFKGSVLSLAVVLAFNAVWAQSQFGDHATVVVVEVPVNVIRNGEPVRGLTLEDFELFDGRKKQEITGVELIDLEAIDAVREDHRALIPSMSLAARRQILFLFDISSSDLGSIGRARSAALEIVQQSLHPSDLVAVAAYAQAGGTRLVQGFTGNRQQAGTAIKNLGRRGQAHQASDPLGLIFDSGPAHDASSTDPQHRKQEAIAEEHDRDLEVLAEAAGALYSKHQFIKAITSFEELANLLSSIEGRKHVVLLSEGYDSELLTGLDNPQRQEVFARQPPTERTYGHSDAAASLRSMIDAFRRADCTIQAIDLSGLDDNQKTSRNAAMFRMADETGGELFRNYNNISAALGKVIERTSVTYLLTFTPSSLEMDGRFHPIKVKLKNRRLGTRVLHRSGYFPPKPFSRLTPSERRLATAADILGGRDGGLLEISALAAPFHVAGGDPYVPVLVEIDGANLVATAGGEQLDVEVFAYAFDESGAARGFFTRRLGLDLAVSRAALLETGLKYWGHLDLEAGDYVVRVLVRNGDTGAAGVASLPLHVPDFAARETALLPVFFPEPVGKWVMARESETEQRAEVAFPFMMGDSPFIPAVTPSVSGGSTRIALIGYNLGEGEIAAHTRLLDENGSLVHEDALELLERSREESGIERLQAEWHPGQLKEGSYNLVATVRDLAAGTEQQSITPIVVRP